MSKEGLEEERIFRRRGMIVAMAVAVPLSVGVEEHGCVLLELLSGRQRGVGVVVVCGNKLLVEEFLGRLDDLELVPVLVLVVGGDVGGADARKHVGVVEVDELVDLGVAPPIEVFEGGVEEELLLEVDKTGAPCTAGSVLGETQVPVGVLVLGVVGEVDVGEDDEQGHQLQLGVYAGLGQAVEGEVEAKKVHAVLDKLDDAEREEEIEDDADQEREVVQTGLGDVGCDVLRRKAPVEPLEVVVERVAVEGAHLRDGDLDAQVTREAVLGPLEVEALVERRSDVVAEVERHVQLQGSKVVDDAEVPDVVRPVFRVQPSVQRAVEQLHPDQLHHGCVQPPLLAVQRQLLRQKPRVLR